MTRMPDEFPYEPFVERSIKEHFDRLGFADAHRGAADFCDVVVRHPESGETWNIECKGKTAAIGTDFDTCLGQLLRRMKPGAIRWGVGLPRIDAYVRKANEIHPDICDRLGVYWLWVHADGRVEVLAPGTCREGDR